ncbi:MAG: RluA family pseudouridine synthase [Kiritimatiellae bacterium]|nr:RluA family pseudouridine synthase [Kiritimatiellia bacterium]
MRQAPRHAAGVAALTVAKSDPKFLQDFLSAKFNLSRRSAKAVIDGRNVWVNRKCVWIARYNLDTGDKVEVPSAIIKAAAAQTGGAPDRKSGRTAALKPAESRRHIRVLWQNENYLVCDKPSGMVSCDDPKSVEAALRVQENIPTLEAVHRLDRDTTGCLLFAKCHAALVAAIEIFKTHKVTKIYHAISAGSFKLPRMRIDAPLDGQNAVSNVVREAVSADASFLRVRIETGRTNQIRRHLSSVRHPIVGDRVFGLKSARDARFMEIPRQMLHASTLSLPDPMAKGKEIKVHAPLPADFRATLRLFGMGK